MPFSAVSGHKSMKTAPAILMDLVSIRSVSWMSNRPIIDYALQYLDRSKWAVDLYSYSDSAGAEKVNLVAKTKQSPEDSAELALVSHTDTVPFDPAWNEAVHPVLRDSKVYGRAVAT
jgi:acetylornithine deacetylase